MVYDVIMHYFLYYAQTSSKCILFKEQNKIVDAFYLSMPNLKNKRIKLITNRVIKEIIMQIATILDMFEKCEIIQLQMVGLEKLDESLN